MFRALIALRLFPLTKGKNLFPLTKGKNLFLVFYSFPTVAQTRLNLLPFFVFFSPPQSSPPAYLRKRKFTQSQSPSLFCFVPVCQCPWKLGDNHFNSGFNRNEALDRKCGRDSQGMVMRNANEKLPKPSCYKFLLT